MKVWIRTRVLSKWIPLDTYGLDPVSANSMRKLRDHERVAISVDAATSLCEKVGCDIEDFFEWCEKNELDPWAE